MTFDQLNLAIPILDAIKTTGYTTPTPIQAEAIPIILTGQDLFGIAQTGTGKTAAFSLPMLHLLSQNTLIHRPQSAIRALICTPTRELAIQIEENITAYGKHLNLKHAVIFGGVDQKRQVRQIQAGIDILVATPGRLLDLVNQGIINLSKVEYFVLDEADRMLDMGFINDVKRVVNYLPSKRQTLFFSATMPTTILKLAASMLTDAAKVEVTPASTTVEKIRQEVYFVEKGNKKKLLIHILQDKSITQVLVFTKTKHGADRVVKDLHKENITAMAIHGNKSQNARQNALQSFKSGTLRVLVATDIASRGIDVEELGCVINYELPNVAETYVHRIGRTGRAGASGIAISFCDDEEVEFLRDINQLTRQDIPVEKDHPYAIDFVLTPIRPSGQPKQKQQGRNQQAGNRPNNNNRSGDSRGQGGGRPKSGGSNNTEKRPFRKYSN